MQRISTVFVLVVPMVVFGAWANVDVGTPTGPGPGSATQGPPGTWTIEGGGEDIWSPSDQFHYLYEQTAISGDFTVSCHVASLSGSPSTWAKAGIMARMPSAAAPPLFQGPESYVIGCTTSANGTMLQWREGENVDAAWNDVRIWEGPDDMHLMLTRRGDDFTLYASWYPQIYQLVETHTHATVMGADVYVGLAVTAHNSDVDPDVLATAVFDQIDLNATPLSSNAPTFFTCSVSVPTVTLDWTNAVAYDQILLFRRDLAGNVSLVTTLGGTAVTYTDTPGDGLWTYYLVAIDGGDLTVAQTCTASMGAGVIDDAGFVRSWLLGGPITDIHPCNTPIEGMTADYLVGMLDPDGAAAPVTEADVLPMPGDVHEVDFISVTDGTAVLGPYLNSQIGPDVNPEALDDRFVWYEWHDGDNGIDQNAIYGDDPDFCVGYACCYLENTTGTTMIVEGGAASDDSIAVVLDNTYVHANGACRGWDDGAVNGIQDTFLMVLSPGEHRLMTKTFEEGGGFGFRLRLRDLAGNPLGEADGIKVKVLPTMTTVPAGVAAPTDLTASATGTTVNLNWINGQAYDSIFVLRVDVNGNTSEQTLGGGATSLTDTVPAEGLYTYYVVGVSGGAGSGAATVSVSAGDLAAIDANGYIKSWLLLGPLSQGGGATPGAAIYNDYIAGSDPDNTPATVTEANALPEAGDRIEIDFGVAASTGVLGPTPSGLNPEALNGIAQWHLHIDADYRIDHTDVYGMDYDNFTTYHVVYLENTTPDPKFLEIVAATDDDCLYLLDNSPAGRTYWDNWNEGSSNIPMVLPAGEHRFLAKTFEGGGGNGIQCRFRDTATGLFVLDGDPDIVIRLVPKTMTIVPPAPIATVTRGLPTMSVGVGAAVTLTITDGPVDIVEIVPANYTIGATNGGGVNGQVITYTNVSDSVSYTVTPTAEGGDFVGFAQDTSNGAWLAVGGLTTPLFPQQIGDWYSADIADPGHTTTLPSSVSVAGADMTISTMYGRDIWGVADEMHYVWQNFPADGAFAIQARVDAFDPLMVENQEWSKVGIMARTFLTQGSPYVFAMMRSDVAGGLPDLDWQARPASDTNAANDGDSFYNAHLDVSFPYWLRLTYNNGECKGFFTPDDGFDDPVEPWIEAFPPYTLNLEGADTVTAGFAVTTHEAAASTAITAELSEVEVTTICTPCTVTRSFTYAGAPSVDFEGTPSGQYYGNAGEVVTVNLAVAGVRSGAVEGCPALATTTITELLPVGWTAANISNGGSFAAGTVTWTLSAAQLGALEGAALTYDVSGPVAASDYTITGSIAEQGSPEAFEVRGQDMIITCNGLGSDGVIRSWLLLGPLGHTTTAVSGPHDENQMRLDHLTDGMIEETDYQPEAGDQITPDYNGAAASTGLTAIPTGNPDLNPGGVPTWHAWRDADGAPVDVGTANFYGNADYSMCYGVCYLDVASEVNVYFAAGSDDAVQILLDGSEIWLSSIDRAWPGFVDLSALQTLSPGMHTLMVKVFEGTGDWNFGIQLQEEFGSTLEGFVQVCLNPTGCCGEETGEPVFKRGDANRDGNMNIADAVYVLQNLFAQGPAIYCEDAADSNDDDGVNIADAVYILQNLFAQGPAIPAPGPDVCGPDLTGHPVTGQQVIGCNDYCAEACNPPQGFTGCPPP